MTDVLVVGEALVDVVRGQDGREVRMPGGSAANVAVALARLGRAVTLHTCLGDDTDGAAVADWLAASGVRTSLSVIPRTAVAEAVLDGTGGATYSFAIRWAPAHVAQHCDVLHVGSIGALLEPGATTVRAAVDRSRATALVTFDPNVRPRLTPDRDAVRRDVEHLVASADVVKVSAEDARWLYPGTPPDAVAGAWARTGPRLVVLTDGPDGARAWTARGDRLDVAAPRVRAVDTIGAGDTFQGALIDGLVAHGCVGDAARRRLDGLDREELAAVLLRAARAAAITVSRAGADPPEAAELG